MRPRPILPGTKLMLTRRVRGRTFLLRPSKKTNRIVGYVLATMAKKWRIKIHAACAMSNHWHVCLTDPHGNIVEFQRDAHQFISRGLNAHHNEVESVWANEPCSRVEFQEAVDLIRKIAYTMANPVEARLVREGSSWPGLRCAWPSKPLTFEKPPKFFRGTDQGGEWPDVAVLELARPPGYEDKTDDELAVIIKNAIDKRETRFRNTYDLARKPFLGAQAVREQSRHGRPKTREPRGRISPKVACRNKWRRIETLLGNKRWLQSYDAALLRWRSGDRDVEFPAGTYKMRVIHKVRCAAPPS